MPKRSERQRLLDELEDHIRFLTLEGDYQQADEAALLYLYVLESRYLAKRAITRRPPHYYTERFPNLSADEFRAMFRTTRAGFSALLDKIQGHPIFSNNSTCPQAHPSLQLGVALARLGVHGTGASVSKIQAIFGIGTGTAAVYTDRVLQALWDVKDNWLCWPDAARRREIGQVMRAEGFPNCVGFVDGTTLPLSQKPAIDGEVYFDRKKRYSVAMQVICDVDKRIIGMHVGCPGSCADSTVFKRMPQYKQAAACFSPGEYLLADSAYGLSKNCIPSYKAPAANLQDNKEFNYCVAKSRVRNEHCIGILKSRWSSLQGMRQQIRTKADMENLVRWVVVCCVLHNMLARLGDAWEEMYLEESREDYNSEDEGIAVLHDEDLSNVGAINFRTALKKTTLETNYARRILPIR